MAYLKCGHREYKSGHCGEMICSNYIGKHPIEEEKPEKWPSDDEEEATREIVALADELSDKVNRDPMPLTGMALLELYLSVDAILMRHDLNPRKLRDAMNYLSDRGNE